MNKVFSQRVMFQAGDFSVFETNIRYVGGLLTCYAFTGDVMFRDKAEYIAKKLLPAFQTPTGIPYSLINFKTGVTYYFIIIFDCKFVFLIKRKDIT